MTFQSPAFFLLIAPLGVLALYLAWRDSNKPSRIEQLGQPEAIAMLLPTNLRNLRRFRRLLWLMALMALIVALARPGWGAEAEIREVSALSVYLSIDVSRSMDALDMPPSRLENARRDARRLLASLPGTSFGLIAFAGSAFVQVPLTDDTTVLAAGIDALGSDALSDQGTDLQRPIEVALASFADMPAGTRAIVMLSDGEAHTGNVADAAAAAREAGVQVLTMGYGLEEGTPVPVADPDRPDERYLLDDRGEPVLTRLDESSLRQLADETGGVYQRAGLTESELTAILQALRRLGSTSQESGSIRPLEQTWLFVAVALILLTVEPLIGEWQLLPDRKLGSRFWPRLLAVLCMLFSASCSESASRNNSGVFEFDAGRYGTAIRAFELAQVAEPDAPEPYLNAGITLALSGDVRRAEAALVQALKTASEEQAVDVYFNLGNLYFQTGRYDNAIMAYREALLLNPDDVDARYNLEIALRRQPRPPTEGIPLSGNLALTPTTSPDGGQPDPAPTRSPEQGQSADVPDPMSPEQASGLLDAVQRKLSQFPSLIPITPSRHEIEKAW